MNRWKRWMIKLARKLGAYGTLDTEKTIRILKTENLHLKQALADAQQYMPWNKHVTVEIDQPGQKQAQSQIGAYEPPEKRTDPAQFGIRRRAMTRQLQENHRYMHHHNTMLKKVQTVRLEPETMNLPAMTAPEDDWTNGGIDQTARHKAVNQ